MENSKYYVTFKNKMSHFDADLDYIDIICNDIENTDYVDSTELFPGSSNEKYKTLSTYKVVDSNRKLVVRHLRSTLYTAYIKDLYEEFTLYIKSMLKEVYENAKVNPERLAGEHKINLPATDILSHYQKGDLIDVVIEGIFQVLENERSTISLISKFHNKIGIEKDSKIINEAIYYLEIRHKLVHTDGCVDEEFRNAHNTLQYTHKGRIKLTYSTIIKAKEAVTKLVEDMDKKIMSAGLARSNTTPRK